MSRFALYCITFLALLATGCPGEGVQWSGQERENAQYIFRSLEAAAEAARLARELPPDATPQQRREVADKLETAYLHAENVTDTVLQKAHPLLWGKFRGEYQPALAQLLRKYRGQPIPEDARPAEKILAFSRWFNSHQPEFRW